MLKGLEAIRQLFTTLFKEFAKPGASFQMLRQDVDGDIVYILWKTETADNRYEIGTGTFVVKDGKIVTETFAGKITPKH
jgi:predicted SnoaL-like aldol condensation-catalyzing enzyme